MSRTKSVVAGYIGVLVFAAFIFLAAGKFVYWQALLYVGIALFGATLSNLLVPKGSDLPDIRSTPPARGGASSPASSSPLSGDPLRFACPAPPSALTLGR